LGEFITPVDLVWGESDRLIPMTYAKRLESELPAVRLTTLPRCGHIPQQECPGAFSKNLQKILDSPVPQRKSGKLGLTASPGSVAG
jgi:pimeloyl-ACP methyl ester carboxylesterase